MSHPSAHSSTPTYGVPSANHGTTRPLALAQKRKRAQREAVDVPLAWVLRDQITRDPAAGIPGRPNPGFVLTAAGTPEWTPSMAGYLLGPQPRALMMALRRLQRIDATAYDYLMAYYVHKHSEREIAAQAMPPVSRWQVASSLKWGVGFLLGAISCDESHAQLRGVTVDDLYQDVDADDDDEEDRHDLDAVRSLPADLGAALIPA